MLLSFSCKNFKSFSKEAVLNMVPEKRLSELRYSILDENANGRKISALSTSVIYGPNAAGKTSLINALSCFKRIVLRGNIRDAESDILRDRVSNAMSFIPFAFSDTVEPVTFDISFSNGSHKFRYSLSMNLGGFLEKESKRCIVFEQLEMDDKTIFTRTEREVEYLELKSIKDMLNVGYKQEETSEIRNTMSKNLDSESLLLTSDFNSFCSKRIVNEIGRWFSTGLMVMNSADRTMMHPEDSVFGEKAIIDIDINEIAKEAGNMLTDLITPQRIQCVKRVSDWRESLRLAARPLVQDKSIQESYVDAMVELVEKTGPYIVLAPGIALPHARPEAGANRLAMALLRVEEPVWFDREKYANLFFVLASADGKSHMNALIQISHIFSKDTVLESFLQAPDPEALWNLLRRCAA